MHLAQAAFCFWLGGAVASAPVAVALRRESWRLAALMIVAWFVFALAAALGLVKFDGGVVKEA